MFHCVACNSPTYYDSDLCFECEEAVSHVYDEDTEYIQYVRGIHPSVIPYDFLSVTYAFETDCV